MLKILASVLCLLSLGCTHALHLYHVSESDVRFNSQKTAKIESDSEQFVILGFAGDTNYVNQAYAQLEEKCPQGSVTNIHTRYSTSHGFFSWTNKIHMQATCVQ